MTATLWAAVAGILLLFVGGWALMRKAAQAERGKAAERGLDHARKARETAEDVSRLDSAALDAELRDGPR